MIQSVLKIQSFRRRGLLVVRIFLGASEVWKCSFFADLRASVSAKPLKPSAGEGFWANRRLPSGLPLSNLREAKGYLPDWLTHVAVVARWASFGLGNPFSRAIPANEVDQDRRL